MTSTLTTAERMATKVQISLNDLEVLADCLATLDGFKGYAISTRREQIAGLIKAGHDAIERAAGHYASAIYCNDHEPEAA